MTAKASTDPLLKLREPFPDNLISKLPKPTKQQTEAIRADFKKGVRCKICGSWHHPDVVHLDYVGHAALTDRLLDVDPHWSWEPMGYAEGGLPAFDRNGGLWIKLTVCGITRPGYGSADGKSGGDAVKEIIGDALRNAAMRFGAALDLWHKGDLHADDGEPAKEASAGSAEGQGGERKVSPGGAVDDSRWAELLQLIEATKTNTGELLGYYNAPDLNALTNEQAAHAKKALEAKLAKMTAAPPKQTFGELLDDEIPAFA